MPATDEDILRDLMHRCTDDIYPPASIATHVVSRQRRRHRRRQLVSLAATGAALGTIATVVAAVPRQAAPAPQAAHGSQPAMKLTAEQRTLYQLSWAAARQREGQGRYVVMREVQDNYQKMTVIDSVTGDTWSYQKVPDAPSVAPEAYHWSPTQTQFAAMPTDPAALRTLLISQYDKQWNQSQALVSRLRKGHVPKATDTESAAGKVFQQAYDMLWNPLVGPPQRAALFKVLAATPGVRVDGQATDKLGRPAVEITWTDPSGGTTYGTYEDPVTTAVLEQTFNFPADGADSGYDLYLSITRASTVPPYPYAGG